MKRVFFSYRDPNADLPDPVPLLVSYAGDPTEIHQVTRNDFAALERAAEVSPSGAKLDLPSDLVERLLAAGLPLRPRSDGAWRVPIGVTVQLCEPNLVIPIDWEREAPPHE